MSTSQATNNDNLNKNGGGSKSRLEKKQAEKLIK